MSDNILPERTPDQIRDDAIRCFNQMAPAKYDDGQARKEVTDNLDKHPDLGGAIREELCAAWFYNESREREIDELQLKVEQLKKRNKHLEGLIRQ